MTKKFLPAYIPHAPLLIFTMQSRPNKIVTANFHFFPNGFPIFICYYVFVTEM